MSDIVRITKSSDHTSYSCLEPHLIALDIYTNGEIVLLVEKNEFTEIFELGKLQNEM